MSLSEKVMVSSDAVLEKNLMSLAGTCSIPECPHQK